MVLPSLPTSVNTDCTRCMKRKAIFQCAGCLEVFCLKHSIDHRQELGQKLDEIQAIRDFIDELYRQLLSNNIQSKDVSKLEQQLKDITTVLGKARENDDFLETNIHQSMQILDEAEKQLDLLKNSMPFMRKLHMKYENTSDLFADICGDIQIKDNGYSIEKDDWFGFSEALGQRDYIKGEHRIQFQIKKLRQNGWLFFGIISKSESMNIDSYSSSSSYGWATQNRIYLAGRCYPTDGDDIINNDIITLTIDCDRKRIQMKNDITGQTMEILVDEKKCSLPWKLHFNLLTGCTLIRLLPISH